MKITPNSYRLIVSVLQERGRCYRAFLLATSVLLIAICCLPASVIWADGGSATRIEFNRDIRPILSNKCFPCHGPDSGKRQAGLRLDREQDAKSPRDGHPAIVSHKVDDSDVMQRVLSDNPDERMPPKEAKQLTADEIAILRRWIEEGAVWSLPWSYVSPVRHEVPVASDSSWPLNWIDRFVLKRLNTEKLKPSPEADKRTLIRRLFIDLNGLPPTPTEVERFLNDSSDSAYERVVDALLDRPRFGERMAAYWLDLVRYADTTGYAGDQVHHISPYRDYVISAFNQNMPFDQFTREQLAGDLLPAPTLSQTIATGYNRLLQTSHEGGVQIKEYLAIYGADRVRNISSVWLAATVGCAQCHDHKYDPYTAKDFYSLKAFFADIDEADHFLRRRDDTPTIRAPEIVVYDPAEAAEQKALQSRKDDLEDRLKLISVALTKEINGQKLLDAEEAASTSKQLQAQLNTVQARIKQIDSDARKTMITVAIEPRTVRLLSRGNWQDESGPIVEPAVPEFLGNIPARGTRPDRLDLANWLTDVRHGAGLLTARVMANRMWYLMFDRGIAAVTDDFGGQGEAPDHPELLDNLALELVENGWNLKQLLKRIVTSRTYRQSSIPTPELLQRDPQNRLLARQARYRQSAEVVRDSALLISGLLVEQAGGPSIRPYQPDGYYRHLNHPKREYQTDTDRQQWRRAVYMHWQRQFLHPMLKAFDAPSREECTAQRTHSNTPLAALVLLNDPTFIECARVFAQRILSEPTASASDRLTFAFQLAVSRDPSAEEAQQLSQLLAEMESVYATDSQAVESLLSIGIAPRPENLSRSELAAWTIVARTILSMSETTTRK